MNNKRVVVFNGPPGCGKDDAANHIRLRKFPSVRRQFKDRLFEVTAAIFGVTQEDLQRTWYTRELKEQPRKELNGLSPRQALIEVSENVIKPWYGKLYFGEALAKSLKPGLTLVSDSGFAEELLPVIDELGPESLLVVRIFGRGTYDTDSRNYIPESFMNNYGVEYVDIDNTGTFDEYLESVKREVNGWLESK